MRKTVTYLMDSSNLKMENNGPVDDQKEGIFMYP